MDVWPFIDRRRAVSANIFFVSVTKSDSKSLR
jgi:hypothetical protein